MKAKDRPCHLPYAWLIKALTSAFQAKGWLYPAFLIFLFSGWLSTKGPNQAFARIPLLSPAKSPQVAEKKSLSIKISAVGDIIMHLPVKKAAHDAGSFDILFNENLKKIFQESDITFANLETVIQSSNPENLDWPGFFYADGEFLASLEKNGIHTLNVANNHILDYGNQGFHNTLEQIKKFKGLTAIGYQTHPRREAGIIKKIKGIRIGFLAFTTLLNLPHSMEIQYPRLNYIQNERDIAQMLESVADLSWRTDLLLVSMHWGDEYSREINPYVLYLAQKIAEAGADIILGHHPHILQKVALIKTKRPLVAALTKKQTLVFFSMGNFISNQGRIEDEVQLRESAILQIKVSMEKNKTPNGQPLWKKNFSWSYIPLWTKNILGDFNGMHLHKFGEQLRLIQLVNLNCEYQKLRREIVEYLNQRAVFWDRERAYYQLKELINLKKRLNSIENILGKNQFAENHCR